MTFSGNIYHTSASTTHSVCAAASSYIWSLPPSPLHLASHTALYDDDLGELVPV